MTNTPTEANAPCPLAVMAQDAADARAYRNESVGMTSEAARAYANRQSDEARAKVAELVRKAGNLPDYLDAYLAWRREQGGDQFLTDIAEHDIQQFRAALAAFSEVQ